jgi:hypothetical protein
MALPENSIGYSMPLEPGDVDEDVIDRLHSRAFEDQIFSFATMRNVARTPIARMPNRYLDPSDDQDLFEEVMRR